MSDPRRDETADPEDRAVEQPYQGDTFDADEGDADGVAFAGSEDENPDDASSAAEQQPSGHGYGYE